MKTLIVLCVLLLATVCIAEEKIDIRVKPHCPKTLMTESCFSCHTAPDWKLKEKAPDNQLEYPTGCRFIDYPENPKGIMEVGDISEGAADTLQKFFAYLRRHKVTHAILQIHSGGGNLFDAWRMKTLMNQFQEAGWIVETRVPGFAASAATIVFLAGNKGHRIASPQSELMFHEVSSYEGGMFFVKKNTPTSTEEQAKIMKHLQDTINTWVPTRGRIDPKEFAEKVKGKEFWATGQQCFDMGFVDRLIKGD